MLLPYRMMSRPREARCPERDILLPAGSRVRLAAIPALQSFRGPAVPSEGRAHRQPTLVSKIAISRVMWRER